MREVEKCARARARCEGKWGCVSRPGLLSIPDMLLYIQTGTGFVYNLERTLLAQVCLPDNRLYGEVDGSTLHCIDSNPRSVNHGGSV